MSVNGRSNTNNVLRHFICLWFKDGKIENNSEQNIVSGHQLHFEPLKRGLWQHPGVHFERPLHLGPASQGSGNHLPRSGMLYV